MIFPVVQFPITDNCGLVLDFIQANPAVSMDNGKHGLVLGLLMIGWGSRLFFGVEVDFMSKSD